MEDTRPIFYVLMRTDMESMNPGKAAAQATHAADQRTKHMEDRRKVNPEDPMVKLYDEWLSLTDQGFGTCVVLGVNEQEMRTAYEIAKLSGYPTDITHDPSYPLMDGNTLHLMPLDTCAWVFGNADDLVLKGILGKFRLHP